MHIDSATAPLTMLIAFNGELIGLVHEADTNEGYIIQHGYEYSGDKLVATGKLVRKEGRVDIIGDSAKDDPKVINDRINKVRAELGLELFPDPPTDDTSPFPPRVDNYGPSI